MTAERSTQTGQPSPGTGQPSPQGAALAQDVQAAFAAVLVDEWVRAGVTDVVACPGSRSTPLLSPWRRPPNRRPAGALSAGRALGGYFALGLGLVTGMPAPVSPPAAQPQSSFTRRWSRLTMPGAHAGGDGRPPP